MMRPTSHRYRLKIIPVGRGHFFLPSDPLRLNSEYSDVMMLMLTTVSIDQVISCEFDRQIIADYPGW